MTHILPLDSNKFTEILWKMQTESIVVFPEGVAVLPWILCGGTQIGIETAKLMSELYKRKRGRFIPSSYLFGISSRDCRSPLL